MKNYINLRLWKCLLVFVLMFSFTMCVTGDFAYAEEPINITPKAPPGVAGQTKGLITELAGWVLWAFPAAYVAGLIGLGGYFFINKDDPGVINEMKKNAKIMTIIFILLESVTGVATAIFSKLGI